MKHVEHGIVEHPDNKELLIPSGLPCNKCDKPIFFEWKIDSEDKPVHKECPR